MIEQPSFFESIRAQSSELWDQLESKPELAGPWHQLFMQVQSPRHVLSELLQNADDAFATEVSVDICDGDFVFRHNGEDFNEDQFSSLCKFGYSNKRTLHTIGFRGVGFKSTFSLGDEVRLSTPTLSVAFQRQRFTEPIWIDRTTPNDGKTEVRVSISDENRQAGLHKNLNEWIESPTSLLFFRNIRCLHIGNQQVGWNSIGKGPIDESEWLVLSDSPETKYLLIRSKLEAFPNDVLAEIQQERMIPDAELKEFPPSQVEIVLGLEGRLFVVLPTGVKTDLPFACNAPFVQDPARVKIKDPEISPTNRWLLKRAGILAARGMLGWLSREDMTLEQRAEAYGMLPDVNRNDNSLEGTCGTLVQSAIEAEIKDQMFLLTEGGDVEPWKGCVAVPRELLAVWELDLVASLFIQDQSVLCHHVEADDVEKLVHWGCIERLKRSNIVDVLKVDRSPRPATWRQLMILWSYLSEEITQWSSYSYRKDLRIVPVQGADVLYSAIEVIRLGERQLLQSQEDWEFLSTYLHVMNQNWTNFLADQRRSSEEAEDAFLGQQVRECLDVLRELDLTVANSTNSVIQQVSSQFFKSGSKSIQDYARLAHIAAALHASVAQDFKFVNISRKVMSANQKVLVDITGDLDLFVEEEWYKQHGLHDAYSNRTSCTEEEWRQWIISGNSRLLGFVPLVAADKRIWGRNEIAAFMEGRGYDREPHFPYVRDNFVIQDWDFEPEIWNHWASAADQEDQFWGQLVARILQQPRNYWAGSMSASVFQIASTTNRKAVTQEPLTPAWIMKLRELPCLQDTGGYFRRPAELLLRTPDTESLLDVEPFVRAELDTEATRPLLQILGVRDTPTGPGRLLERLEALSLVDNPPILEVERWCHRLDQLINRCSTEEFQTIKTAFETKSLVVTADGGWARASEVFLSAEEEDAPGAAIVHPSVNHFSLWRKVGIAERPTEELAIDWLKSLSSGQSLTPVQMRRVRALLRRYPVRIWNECGHWLNLAAEWALVDTLSYSLTMQSLVPWANLFPAVKQKTGDLQGLAAELCHQYPFSDLDRLADVIEYRFNDQPHSLSNSELKPWLTSLGNGLQRIELDNADETARIQETAIRLASTSWKVVAGLETVPYISETPAGPPQSIEVLWQGQSLYVVDRSMAKMAKPVATELGRSFGRPDIVDAINICYERPSDFVTEFLEENFKLAPAQVLTVENLDPEDLGGTENHLADGLDLRGDQDAYLVTNNGEDDHLIESPNDPGLLPGDEQEGDQGDASPEGAEDDPEPGRSHRPRPVRPNPIELFALANGYQQDGIGRFICPAGGFMARLSGETFHWERRDGSGNVVRYYWGKDHCLQHEPLQLPAEVWGLCDQFPDRYSLVLTDIDDEAIEITGEQLKEMSAMGQLTLHPATYRLEYNND